ncbi:hypothetical protein RBS60_01395 [Sinomonas sp. ASV486]|uniref:hypothetical protein n=1 Tax=Sinomonas sp. ASV486 TaxID=3051170 RepID=UPI0027DE71D5|nr:hypothetical protein [Sinomonas sp. ASV486]MDQ4488847.1 hypothetical protein [Sinomonas sp. ASV486]
MDPLWAARQFKHAAFVASKRLGFWLRDTAEHINDVRWKAAEERSPFHYDPDRYRHTFLARPDVIASNNRSVPSLVYSFWLGPRPMSKRRLASLRALESELDVPLVLVTDETVNEFLVDGHPLHPAYSLLSDGHRSDYLRTYFMHHHGGGYSDIKRPTSSWTASFQAIADQTETWAVGYREVTSNYVPDLPRYLGKDIKRHYRAVFGPSAFIVRPSTSLTSEWYREMHSRMEYFAGALAESPGSDFYNPAAGYPIRWTELLGDVLQPLCLKYQDRLLFDDRVKPVLTDYR